jgi:ABC-type transport system involved in cytochrome bd biosynthesis fused ATPase/permease subunit
LYASPKQFDVHLVKFVFDQKCIRAFEYRQITLSHGGNFVIIMASIQFHPVQQFTLTRHRKATTFRAAARSRRKLTTESGRKKGAAVREAGSQQRPVPVGAQILAFLSST